MDHIQIRKSEGSVGAIFTFVSLMVVAFLFGRWSIGDPEKRIVYETYTISTEQKECEAEGGEFKLKYSMEKMSWGIADFTGYACVRPEAIIKQSPR